MIGTLVIYQFTDPIEFTTPFHEEEEITSEDYWDDLRYRLSLIEILENDTF
jgi:hypothetical protein